ncbi:HalOD1 output domain-containing protein [Natrinema salsiterrestre]|uniref:Halobacterial output domain-containing protein n=1 Tax=Natrinema salsiterrestre TaxID=2950540 RepID=A0A9Q4L587_9EURY|nr:HalOD1 output domain-containing protein [Natrinema salsiterrestre]MDF9747877.1 hypothetical protein [Natrinema salsiterrestre]
MEKDKISTRVILDVAKRDGTDPVNLPPLHNTINADALDALFELDGDGETEPKQVEFSYHGYTVLVEYDGETDISLEDEQAPAQ